MADVFVILTELGLIDCCCQVQKLDKRETGRDGTIGSGQDRVNVDTTRVYK